MLATLLGTKFNIDELASRRCETCIRHVHWDSANNSQHMNCQFKY